MTLDAMIHTEGSAQTLAAAPEPDASKRIETFVWGIPQNGLQQKQREVQLDEPPPMPPNSELTYIGKPTVRYDGPAKAMGKGKYTADINLPGMLYARLVDATIPHGRILSIDTSAAEKLQGVRACPVGLQVLLGAATGWQRAVAGGHEAEPPVCAVYDRTERAQPPVPIGALVPQLDAGDRQPAESCVAKIVRLRHWHRRDVDPRRGCRSRSWCRRGTGRRCRSCRQGATATTCEGGALDRRSTPSSGHTGGSDRDSGDGSAATHTSNCPTSAVNAHASDLPSRRGPT